MDLTVFDAEIAKLQTAVPLVGAAVVGVLVLTLSFPFIMKWSKKAYNAATGSAGS